MIDRYTLPDMGAIWSEENKFNQWLRVELAVCEAWAEEGVIPQSDLEKLKHASVDPLRVKEIEKETDHDVIAFVRAVGETVGPERRWIHLGLTSSDVVDTALSLLLVESGKLILRTLSELEQVVTDLAVKYKDTPMIGRTHGVHAEPITFGYKMLVWLDELRRVRARMTSAVESVRIGKLSGAVGTHANIPPSVEERALSKLGLKVAPVATQVIGRDIHADFLQSIALIGGVLERHSTEIRHLQRTEVREAEQPFGEKQQGSSAMPHKRNPEKMERISGLARVLRGYALTALENIALWHERDISHSSTERIIFPGACTLVHYMLVLMRDNLEGLRVYPERMLYNLHMTGGLVFSQRVLLALVEAGMDRQEAYKLIQKYAMQSWETGQNFADLLRQDERVMNLLGESGLREAFSLEPHLKYIYTGFERMGVKI